jgi:hypothetical protein
MGDSIRNMRLDDFFRPMGLGEGYALLIGINRYRFARNLLGATNDVKGYKQKMLQPYGWKRQNIKTLLDGKATKANILSAL